MALLLLLAFIAVPLVEIAVFVEVGEKIGAISTILATVLTALAGTMLLRAQGLATLERARVNLDQGVLPARELFDGLCLLLAGALLLVPGFVTDAVGLLLFVPPLRAALRQFVGRRLEAGDLRMHYRTGQHGEFHRGEGRSRKYRADIIEGEFEEVSDNGEAPPKDPSDSRKLPQ